MKNFIELSTGENKILVNIDSIALVYSTTYTTSDWDKNEKLFYYIETKNGSLPNEKFCVAEDVATIKKLIEDASI